ncbi:hypothetical protein JZ785_20685 [Alicyclobacillus curvatus]|nr:hypothetical protein JZ785_20685 [Alicyclobacillus curvatus]
MQHVFDTPDYPNQYDQSNGQGAQPPFPTIYLGVPVRDAAVKVGWSAIPSI